MMDVRTGEAAEPAGDVAAVLGEGPYWVPEESCLFWVDILRGLLHRTAFPSGETVSTTMDAISAVFPAFGGGMLITGGHRLTLLPAPVPGDGGSGRTVAEVPAREGVRFNDASVDPAGRVWAGSMHTGETDPVGVLYRLDRNGLTPVITGVTVSNGLGWSPDGSRMYHVDSPRRQVAVLDYDPATGEASQRRAFADLRGMDGLPDGLTVDADGCVWVAMFGGGALRRFTPSGQLDAVLPLPVAKPTSCAFAGPDLAELYVTTASVGLTDAERASQPLAGRLLRLRPGPVGLPSSTVRASIPS